VVIRRLVVVGGDAAGMAAAAQARRRQPAETLQIVAFERGRFTSYSACGIPYWIAGTVDGPDGLVARSPEEHRRQGIDVRTCHEVIALDTAARTVTARILPGADPAAGEPGSTVTVPYDDVVLATGSVPTRPPIDGVGAPGVFGVQTLEDGVALRAALDDGARRVVVVGGGYVGLEVAEAMTVRGVPVTIVDLAPTPIATFDPDVGAEIAEVVRGLGIELVLSDGAAAIATGPDGRATGVRTRSGRVLPADAVVLGLGVRPNSALAVAAGVPVGPGGGIVTDQRMRTPVPGVWAAGDCVESLHRVSGQRVVAALGTHANKQGRVAGINLGGGYATFPGVIGTAVTKICSLEVARTGLTEREAQQAGFAYVTATVDSTTRAGYFPDTQPIRVKLLAERRSGRLLGAQIWGQEGAAKRIDVLATAIWNEMPVDEVLGLDLSYAPPFAPVWDPVLIAARKAQEAVEADLRRG
jgi:NADPH-dependent 2,4-dienoyl-CoA reductase/sulfur reductase-like enzyme